MKLKLSISVFLCLVTFTIPTYAAEIAGYVERIKGSATATNQSGTTPLVTGTPIMVDDSIATGSDSRLAVRFIDQSKLTLGENALIIVDDLVYDASAKDKGAAQQTVDVVRGVFNFVSGQIAKVSYENVVLRTPVATIGIRGTDFLGGELTVGMAPGRPHYGFQIQDGAIEVLAPGGTVLLDEPGEGTFLPLTRVKAPTAVRQWTDVEAAEAKAALAF